jgi:hypothetical protein
MENSLDVLECELIPALGDRGQNLFFTLKNWLLHLLQHLQPPNFADLQIAQIISERFAISITRATIN